MKKIKYIILMVIMAFTFSGCGGSGGSIETGDYETALYLAYSTTNSTNPMYLCAVGGINLFILDMQSKIFSYLMQCSSEGNCQSSIDLSNPPSGFNVPAGVTGTITSNLTMSALTINADLTLNGYKDNVTGINTYNGKIRIVGSGLTTSYDKLSKMDISVPTLTIDCTNLKFSKITYTGYTISVDNTSTYPKYTLNGGLIVDSRGYNYTGYTFQSSSSLALTISGDVTEGDFRFNVTGSPTADASGIWRSGTVTLGYKEGTDDTITTTCTVTLSNTSASFQITDGDQWEWTDWINSGRCP